MLSEKNAIQELKKVSAYAGNRVDLVQAGGGNTSVKTSNRMMYIKASGFELKDLAGGKGIASVEQTPAMQDTFEDFSEWNKRCVNSDKKLRPSIEVSMHALLGDVVMHTHPVLALGFLCVKNSKERVDSIFRGRIDFLYVPYARPGIELGILLKETLKTAASARPPVIFLENHGIVVGGNTAKEVIKTHEKVLNILQHHDENHSRVSGFELFKPEDSIDIDLLRAIRASAPEFPSLACMRAVNGAASKGILFPDAAVYCGGDFIELDVKHKNIGPGIVTQVHKFKKIWNHPPHIWKIGDFFICAAKTISNAQSVAEAWWAHETANFIAGRLGSPRYLSLEMVHELMNWEAELYRKNLSEVRR